MRSVRIEWVGPFSLEEVSGLNDEDNDYGIYQIYGYHIVYGTDSLLYIGKAEGMTFSQRFAQHAKWLLEDLEEEDVSIRVGRIAEEDYEPDPADLDWTKLLRDVEALTIHWHSPAYNSSNIGTYNGQPLEVVNRGKRGSLDERYKSCEL